MARAAKKSKPRFQYKPRTRDQVKKRADQRGGNFDSIFKEKFSVLSIKEGNTRLRIMPPTWPDADHYGLDIFVHYGVGPSDESYLCLKEMLNKPCPVCDARREADKSGDEEAARELNYSKRVACWVINRDKEEEGPIIWSQPWTMDRDISQLSEDNRTGEILLVDDPEEGYDVEFNRAGSGIKTKYTGIQISRRPSPLCDDAEQQDEWLDYICENPLPECLQYYDYDHIKSVLDGGASSEEEDLEDEEEDEVVSPRTRRSRHVVEEEEEPEEEEDDEPEDEEDDDPEEEEEEEPEEEVRSPRTRRRPAVKEEEEEEEEEAPRARSKTADRLASMRRRNRK